MFLFPTCDSFSFLHQTDLVENLTAGDNQHQVRSSVNNLNKKKLMKKIILVETVQLSMLSSYFLFFYAARIE